MREYQFRKQLVLGQEVIVRFKGMVQWIYGYKVMLIVFLYMMFMIQVTVFILCMCVCKMYLDLVDSYSMIAAGQVK